MSPPAARDLHPASLARIAREAAEAATRVHMAALGRVGVSDALDKGRSDFVSAVDLEAQEAALAVIRRALPGAWILAEEETPGDGATDADTPGDATGAGAGTPLWIVDPLDGTTNFLHRHPAFCASVGVVVDGIPVAGAVVAGALGEAYQGWSEPGPTGGIVESVGLAESGGIAESGDVPEAAEIAEAPGGARRPPRLVAGEAWFEGHGGRREPLAVSRTGTLGPALVGTGFPFKRPGELPGYLVEFERILRRSAGIRREGAAALDLCRLARGSLDAFWEGTLAPWDVAGGLAILRAAGGTWSGPGGAPYAVVEGGPLRAANAPDLLATLHRVLAGDGEDEGGS
jgi:myo-inositol-1(or 4)-monophosphatase